MQFLRSWEGLEHLGRASFDPAQFIAEHERNKSLWLKISDECRKLRTTCSLYFDKLGDAHREKLRDLYFDGANSLKRFEAAASWLVHGWMDSASSDAAVWWKALALTAIDEEKAFASASVTSHRVALATLRALNECSVIFASPDGAEEPPTIYEHRLLPVRILHHLHAEMDAHKKQMDALKGDGDGDDIAEDDDAAHDLGVAIRQWKEFAESELLEPLGMQGTEQAKDCLRESVRKIAVAPNKAAGKNAEQSAEAELAAKLAGAHEAAANEEQWIDLVSRLLGASPRESPAGVSWFGMLATLVKLAKRADAAGQGEQTPDDFGALSQKADLDPMSDINELEDAAETDETRGMVAVSASASIVWPLFVVANAWNVLPEDITLKSIKYAMERLSSGREAKKPDEWTLKNASETVTAFATFPVVYEASRGRLLDEDVDQHWMDLDFGQRKRTSARASLVAIVNALAEATAGKDARGLAAVSSVAACVCAAIVEWAYRGRYDLGEGLEGDAKKRALHVASSSRFRNKLISIELRSTVLTQMIESFSEATATANGGGPLRLPGVGKLDAALVESAECCVYMHEYAIRSGVQQTAKIQYTDAQVDLVDAGGAFAEYGDDALPMVLAMRRVAEKAHKRSESLHRSMDVGENMLRNPQSEGQKAADRLVEQCNVGNLGGPDVQSCLLELEITAATIEPLARLFKEGGISVPGASEETLPMVHKADLAFDRLLFESKALRDAAASMLGVLLRVHASLRQMASSSGDGDFVSECNGYILPRLRKNAFFRTLALDAGESPLVRTLSSIPATEKLVKDVLLAIANSTELLPRIETLLEQDAKQAGDTHGEEALKLLGDVLTAVLPDEKEWDARKQQQADDAQAVQLDDHLWLCKREDAFAAYLFEACRRGKEACNLSDDACVRQLSNFFSVAMDVCDLRIKLSNASLYNSDGYREKVKGVLRELGEIVGEDEKAAPGRVAAIIGDVIARQASTEQDAAAAYVEMLALLKHSNGMDADLARGSFVPARDGSVEIALPAADSQHQHQHHQQQQLQ
jgi:hypothetical protein